MKKDDGIYSSYVTTFTSSGRYNVQVEVRDTNGTVVSEGIIGVSSPTKSTQDSQQRRKRSTGDDTIEPFQRLVSAGSFMLESYDGK